MPVTNATLEICVESPAGVAAAIAGGADRIELCSALAVGGLTPSAGLAEAALAAVRQTGIPVFAMVRPRPGDFTYDRGELAVAIGEARALLSTGVDGLVFGTCAGGRVDTATAQAWMSAVRDAAGRTVPCTFHRAIDLTDDPVASVEIAAQLGFDRILTSGGAIRADEGAATIARMVASAGSAIRVMAGSGVRPDTIPVLAAAGVREFHASASRPSGALDPRVAALGFASGPSRVTDATLVAALRAATNATSR
ncbi:hypothetical protein ASE86_15185 [Sphingomonas sp. Leaf33]|uniref:copper homeostasis protein CutC n=1 Tax=Sphingomonas sp. Leaf33 TaxID=1736215 RepID=UPI0006FD825F|nr:copper homeostasis protein CutC [Sphingomonas sp. Leaf33]KQN20594.1 hypothetical protein ASE86_15185 [Sphingomonas sp. Leaf33]